MVRFAIRCQPSVPVAADELEGWLEQKVKELRVEAPHSIVRLSTLSQRHSSTHLEIGWLVELEVADGEPLLSGHRLEEALRDMRLLGLQPTLLAAGGAASGKNSAPRDAYQS